MAHQNFEEFEKFAKKTDILNNLPNIAQPWNYIGEGRHNIVYSIPGNDVFLLRINKKHLDSLRQKNPLTKSENPFPEINIGQKVGQIGKHIQVIIKQNGFSNGIPSRMFLDSYKPTPQEIVPWYIENLKAIANMPQKAYNNLAKEIKTVTKKKYFFDFYNPNNILIDEKKQEFNLVDIEPCVTKIRDYINFCSKKHLFLSLIDNYFMPNVYKSASKEDKKSIRELCKTIKAKTEATPMKKNSLLFALKQQYDKYVYKNLAHDKYQQVKKILKEKD
ncbi:MAG: hypothetical protein PHE78_02325 [Candidatus Gastranaerophilales bacterium]|nr:hypothetical protein [Candidatus Gastranaerophilales bacterium]